MFLFNEEVTKRMLRYSFVFMIVLLLYQVKFANLFLDDLRIFSAAALLIGLILYWHYKISESLPTKQFKKQIGGVSFFIIASMCIEFIGEVFLAGTNFQDAWGKLYHLAYVLLPVCTCILLNNAEYQIADKKRRILMNLTCFLIPVVWIFYYERGPFLFAKLALPPLAGFCMCYVLFLEYCIYRGFLPTYSFYNEILKKASIEMLVYDKKDEIVFQSDNAHKMEGQKRLALMQSESSIREGDYEYHSCMLPGGYALWRMNIHEQIKLQKDLEEIRTQLSEEYRFLEEERDANQNLAKIREQSRIYNRISKELKPKRDQLLALFSEIEDLMEKKLPQERLLKKACFLAIFMKRKSNLLLLSEISQSMSSHELGLCLRESMKYLSDLGIDCAYNILDEMDLSPEMLYYFYDSFEEIAESLLDDLAMIYVSVRAAGKDAILRIELQRNTDVTHDLSLPPFLKGAQIQTDDDTVYITLTCERT